MIDRHAIAAAILADYEVRYMVSDQGCVTSRQNQRNHDLTPCWRATNRATSCGQCDVNCVTRFVVK